MSEYLSHKPEQDQDRGSHFPVVGVVASAGSVAAFSRLLQRVPSDSGMAFVVIPNRSGETAGALASALAAATVMPVTSTARKTTIEPNRFYVIPPDKLTRISGSMLVRVPRRNQRETLRPVGYFLESLALDRKALAIGVVISGLGADGARGVQAIREAGGIAVVLSTGSAKGSGAAVERMRHELTSANERLQEILAERDEANQELLAANEEIQSSIEELQTFNEELETSRDQLQSTNEELNVVNEELQNRNRELGRSNDDLANLLSSTTIPILMVDNDLRIRRVTPAAERLFNVRADAGHPIGDIRLRLGENLDSLIRRVIDTSTGEEMELLDREGRWNVLRVRPYRTGDNRIEGAVLTMLDIDELHRAQTAADQAREFAESIVESVQIPLLVLKSDLRIRVANQAFLAAYGRQPTDIENRALDEIGKAQWSLPEFKRALARLSNQETSSEELECLQDVPGVGKRTVLINARRVRRQREDQILIAVHDITAHKHAERLMAKEAARLKRSVEQVATALLETEDALRLSREELRALSGSLLRAQDEERRRVSRELHDDVSQNMAMLQFDIEALEQSLPPFLESEKQRLLAIRDAAAQLSGDLRRIAYALHPSTLDLLGLTVALSAYAREFSRRTGIPVECSASDVPAELPPDIASSFYRIAQEALRNVARHAGGGVAQIRLTGDHSWLTLAIHDNGPGFDREAVRGQGGLGLVSMEERARLIHASFQLETAPGRGVSITVSAPLEYAT